MVDTEKLRQDRLNFLEAIYKRTGGSTRRAIRILKIGISLRFSSEYTMNILDYLKGNGLVVEAYSGAKGRIVMITTKGIDEVEKAIAAREADKQIAAEISKGQLGQKKVFIAYIDEESNLALKLKDWIEQSYPGVGVFVSRSKNDIPAGDEWLERIKAALGEGRIFIPICGPSWLSHFWISFEMGCSWIKDIKILPICHSGQKAEGLPIPISLSQGLELEDSEFIDRLFIGISKQLGFEKVPEIDKAKMHRQLLQAAKNSVSEKPSVKKQPQLVNEHELTKEELDILLGLARSEDGLTATDLAEHFNVSTQRVTHFLDKLSSKKLVNMSANLLIGTTYFLTREGRKYLFDHGLL